MKKWGIGLFLIFFFTVNAGVSSCTGIVEQNLLAAPTATPIVTFSCAASFGAYDNLSDCNLATSANCTSTWENFPNGSTALCYMPVAGWQSCQANPATWIYTENNWCIGPVATLPDASTHVQYERQRSVISCSSTTCACNSTQELSSICYDNDESTHGLVDGATPGVTSWCYNNSGAEVHPSSDGTVVACPTP